ncbi:DUF1924 domain-containing protein [Malaciobacter mytili]|uniref:Cytochrome c domain-containing protein n=1 Tax=Malaciobacter mytili LMG 24559 TaxID=1032238 RepID=A0AAX2AGN1_9BACT|nr:DUF1924 domain-containing protein [Malaciobacter mytili]AXH16290.1 DUF1924 domain-containing protein [Malaciobacter mytili LMG 24559]RXI44696.1 hypothetical protein CRU99_04950 [Malaciobacter mytili]RXK13803.1 hypothetical protein CP985_12710 [Malaciobacter mytili LMG 24559]
MKSLLLIFTLITLSWSTNLDEYLNTLKQEATKENPNFKEFNVKRGEEIFTSKHIGKKGKEIACTSCHGIDLTKTSENFFTAKKIEPLSTKANPSRLTDVKKVQKWLKRNFNDVYNRVGTAQEKGDVLVYILSK